jgi:hypothetical protein
MEKEVAQTFCVVLESILDNRELLTLCSKTFLNETRILLDLLASLSTLIESGDSDGIGKLSEVLKAANERRKINAKEFGDLIAQQESTNDGIRAMLETFKKRLES